MTQLASGWDDRIRPPQERTRQFYIERALEKRAAKLRGIPKPLPIEVAEAEPNAPADLPFNQWRITTSPAGLHRLSQVTALALEHEAKQRAKQAHHDPPYIVFKHRFMTRYSVSTAFLAIDEFI